jgi:hypothetical protein
MEQKKILLGGAAVLMLVAYNSAQPGLREMRTMTPVREVGGLNEKEATRAIRKQRYGPSMEWLDRVRGASTTDLRGRKIETPKLDFRMLSSLMLAGLASGFKSQVANLLWMKSDEYWHKGMLTRQNPIMEAVVTLDPQFLEAWDTAGWHWAYNIFADLPNRPDLKVDDKMTVVERGRRNTKLQAEQDKAINVGLDYYARGTQMNPDKYMLWFKFGWTRAEKAGYNDEDTVNLYRTARQQPDAREQEMSVPDPQNPGQMRTKKVQGIDLMGRTIGHAYERMPHIGKALDTYAEILDIKDKPEQRARLREAGRYWAKYSSLYSDIVTIYNEGDAVTRAQVKKLVPDVEKLIKAHQFREEMARYKKGEGSQPTGAYVSMSARYLPAWELWQAGQHEAAARVLIGVVNADPRYHLQGLPVMEKVWALRGDAPQAIQAAMEQQREAEREQTQEIALHMLGTIYGELSARETDPQRKKALALISYEMWYRARERDTLNFQAKRMTTDYEAKYDFQTPQHIVKQVQESRKRGTGVIATPTQLPNVDEYLKKVA